MLFPQLVCRKTILDGFGSPVGVCEKYTFSSISFLSGCVMVNTGYCLGKVANYLKVERQECLFKIID